MRKSIPDVTELPDFYKNWSASPDDLASYAINKITSDMMIAVTTLFIPDFVAYGSCVFRGKEMTSASQENFENWKIHLKNDLEAVQRVMNHIHIGADWLNHPGQDLSYHNLEYLGTVFVQTWACTLKAQFPDRDIIVAGEKDEFEDYVITFWQRQTHNNGDK